MFKHPKYYKELRKRNNLDQAISGKNSTESAQRAPGPGLKQQAQASSAKPQAPSESNNKLQAPSPKHEASSSKPQASSSKIFEPGNI
jgi:tRNA nucleotidyltransferase/poly(A) polymerase